MSETWNTNGYQYDDSNYNYDAYYVTSFENEQSAFMGVCALASHAEGSIPSLGSVNAGSVQNVSLDGMDSHKACLNGMCESINTTVDRMGNALNIRFEKELEAGTLFLTGDIPDDFDYASYIKKIAINNADAILENLRGVSFVEGFGDDLLGQSRIDWKTLESFNPESYQRAIESLAKAVLDKDPTTWTNDDMYALYAYQQKLSEAVDNTTWGSKDRRELKSELKSLTKAMESAGLRDFDNFKTFYLDYGIDMASMNQATQAALAKDPSEWSDYEKAAMIFNYYNLQELMAKNCDGVDSRGLAKNPTRDYAYYEDQYRQLGKVLKPEGLVPYSTDEQAWLDKKNAWTMAWQNLGDVASALFSGDMATAGEEWQRFQENYSATTAVGQQLSNEAMVGTFESAYDGLLTLWAMMASPFVDEETKAAYQAKIQEDLQGQYADATRAANADSFAGSWIPIDSAQGNHYLNVYGQMLDESAGIVVYGLFGPGAGVATAGLIGAGNAAQMQIENVGDMYSALSLLTIAQAAATNAYGTAAMGSIAFGAPAPSGGQGQIGSESLVPAGEGSTALTVPGADGALTVPDAGGALIIPGAEAGALAVPTDPAETPTFGTETTTPELPGETAEEAAASSSSSSPSVPDNSQPKMREEYLERAQDPKVKNLVDKLYRPNADIGDGGTADCLRYELATGDLKSPNGHLNKAANAVSQIYDMLQANPDCADRELLLELANDLIDAIPADTDLSTIPNRDVRNNVRKYLINREKMIEYFNGLE